MILNKNKKKGWKETVRRKGARISYLGNTYKSTTESRNLKQMRYVFLFSFLSVTLAFALDRKTNVTESLLGSFTGFSVTALHAFVWKIMPTLSAYDLNCFTGQEKRCRSQNTCAEKHLNEDWQNLWNQQSKWSNQKDVDAEVSLRGIKSIQPGNNEPTLVLFPGCPRSFVVIWFEQSHSLGAEKTLSSMQWVTFHLQIKCGGQNVQATFDKASPWWPTEPCVVWIRQSDDPRSSVITAKMKSEIKHAVTA